MIYLDANATTQVAPEVMEAMMPFLTDHFANPSASYSEGAVARRAIDRARQQLAELIDCEPEEIIFMSGGTESCNAAIASAMTLDARRTHFVISKSEHSAVLEFARRWVITGRPVTELDVDRGGRLNLNEMRGATRAGQTALVSVMWANNETGVIGPIEEALQIAHERGSLFHTDAVQAVGKVRLSVNSVSAPPPVRATLRTGSDSEGARCAVEVLVQRGTRHRPICACRPG